MPEVTLAVLDQFHPRIAAAIEQAAPASWTVRAVEASTQAARAAVLREADLAFVMAAPVPADLVAAAQRLRFIQKLGAGVDRIDLEACRRLGIAVARLNAGNSVPVAEHTIALMLAVYRRLPQIDARTRAGTWSKEDARGTHRQLQHKTVGLIGFGAVGREVAKRLRGFDVTVLSYDPLAAPPELKRSLAVRRVELDDLLRSADIVSLHLPLLPDTEGILGAARIRAMKPGAVLINCARGGLVDEAALAAALEDGHLFGAGIDAFAREPPRGSRLLELENTVVTPHLAGATLDNFARVIARAVANAQTVLRGGALPADDVVILG